MTIAWTPPPPPRELAGRETKRLMSALHSHPGRWAFTGLLPSPIMGYMRLDVLMLRRERWGRNYSRQANQLFSMCVWALTDASPSHLLKPRHGPDTVYSGLWNRGDLMQRAEWHSVWLPGPRVGPETSTLLSVRRARVRAVGLAAKQSDRGHDEKWPRSNNKEKEGLEWGYACRNIPI